MKSEMFEANQSRISHQDLAAFSFSFIINLLIQIRMGFVVVTLTG